MADIMKEDDEKPGAGEELVIVEDDPKARADDAGEDGADDPRGRAAADDEQDIDPDDPDGDEREAIRERRRLEKVERKQRREEAIKRDKVELDFLRKRNDDLERRLTAQEQRAQQQDLSAVDARLQQALRDAQTAETVIAKAVAAGNGEDVTQAMRFRDEAMARAQQLNAFKAQQQAAQQAAPPVDPSVLDHAQRFIKENAWYDPQGRDEDSSVVLAIDNALVRDGFDPRSAEYWDELRRRAARRLPDRFKSAPARTPRGGPAVGSGREHAPESTRREVYISPERKQALIEAGVWDDPVLRMKYVKRYAEYDRTQRTGA
jgi:hypothetical protein